MKEFRKMEDELLICEECGSLHVNKTSLSRHINKDHKNTKVYYDKWIKDNGDGICKTCGSTTIFLGLRGYRDYCCVSCHRLSKNSQDKQKQTSLYLYGNSNFNNKKQEQTTKLKRYGSVGYNNREKSKQTCKLKYGVDYVLQYKDFFKKYQNSGYKINNYKNTFIKYQGSYELDFLEKFYEKYPDI